jgi:ribonuclease P protein component
VYRLKLNSGPDNVSLPPHIGLVASKKIGGAVVRNQVRRYLSEAIRGQLSQFNDNSVYVFVTLNQISTANSAQVEEAVMKIFK